MATVRAKNVVILSADNDTVSGPLNIEYIITIAGTTNPSAQLKLTNTSGTTIWETGVLADNARIQDEVQIRLDYGDVLHADIAGTGTKVYLYEKFD
jgi:hypothetical protein